MLVLPNMDQHKLHPGPERWPVGHTGTKGLIPKARRVISERIPFPPNPKTSLLGESLAISPSTAPPVSRRASLCPPHPVPRDCWLVPASSPTKAWADYSKFSPGRRPLTLHWNQPGPRFGWGDDHGGGTSAASRLGCSGQEAGDLEPP